MIEIIIKNFFENLTDRFWWLMAHKSFVILLRLIFPQNHPRIQKVTVFGYFFRIVQIRKNVNHSPVIVLQTWISFPEQLNVCKTIYRLKTRPRQTELKFDGKKITYWWILTSGTNPSLSWILSCGNCKDLPNDQPRDRLRNRPDPKVLP